MDDLKFKQQRIRDKIRFLAMKEKPHLERIEALRFERKQLELQLNLLEAVKSGKEASNG